MRTLLLTAALAVALPATAGAATLRTQPRPDDVFVAVDMAPLASELPLFSKSLARINPLVSLNGVAGMLPSLLGKLMDVPSVDGIDFAKPLHLALLNPTKHPHPLLFVAVADARALKASLKTAKLSVVVTNGWAAVGDPAAVQLAGNWLRTLSTPAHGLHASVYVPPIWAAFGAQMRAQQSVMASSLASTPGSTPELNAMISSAFAGLLDAAEQSEQLSIDLTADDAALRLALALDVKADAAATKFFALQKPGDFALLSKLPAMQGPLLGAGSFDFSPLKDWMINWMLGADPTQNKAQATAAWTEFERIFSHELAVIGTTGGGDPNDLEIQYLAKVTDAAKATETFARLNDTFLHAGTIFGTMVRKAVKQPAPFTYDGLKVLQSHTSFAFKTPPAGYTGPTKVDQYNAWTGFDELLAFVASKKAPERIRQLVDAARHGKGTLQLDAGTQASLADARANQDSVWMHIDLSKMWPPTAGPSPFMPGTALSMGVAFQPRRATLHLRF
jgi:hypothetical protein